MGHVSPWVGWGDEAQPSHLLSYRKWQHGILCLSVCVWVCFWVVCVCMCVKMGGADGIQDSQRETKKTSWLVVLGVPVPTHRAPDSGNHLGVARPHLECGVRRLDIGKPDSVHSKEWSSEKPGHFQIEGNLVLILKWKRVPRGSIVLRGQKLVCRELCVGSTPEELPRCQIGCAEESGVCLSACVWASWPPRAPDHSLECQCRVFTSGRCQIAPSDLWLWVLCSCCCVFCLLLSPLCKRFYFQ